MKRSLVVLMLTVGFTAASASVARAELWLRVCQGATCTLIEDGQAGDGSGLVDTVTFVGTVGDYTFTATTGSSDNDLSDPFAPRLSLTVDDLVKTGNTSGDPLTVAVTDTDFTFPTGPTLKMTTTASVDATFTNSATGSANVQYQSAADTNNCFFGESYAFEPDGDANACTANTTLDSLINLNVATNGSLADSDSSGGPTAGVTFLKSGNYSLTLFGTFAPTVGNTNLQSGAQLRIVGVPEPGSLTLLGTGLVAFAALARRRRRS